ncbi:MAG: hypothetical protein KBT08_03280 [Bacteroidales bacterium]|nr:hypothetical protein [Candidatus Cryptobacteroides onthequi]
MKSKIFHCIIMVSAALSLWACDQYADFDSGPDVSIDITINRVSAGFVDITFTPDRPAYFLYSVDRVIPGIDPDKYEQAFMDLALDSAYVEYVKWRHDQYMNLETTVADFASHNLSYGKTDYTQNFLQPDTDYWVYGFVVDAQSNKANGRLFWTTIHTTNESIFKDIRFRYRIKGTWDYVYPYDIKSNELVTDVPWVGQTADSLQIRDLGFSSPGKYFDSKFITDYHHNYGSTFLGVYAHDNNGVGDGTSTTRFEVGHTYYTAMATLDGPRNECFDIYKFTWEGPEMELMLTHEDSTMGEW